MKFGNINQAPAVNSSRRESGKSGMQQHNKDRMGSCSGPMGTEDHRRDKYGSRHNQDARGLRSPATGLVRKELAGARRKLKRRSRTGSRK